MKLLGMISIAWLVFVTSARAQDHCSHYLGQSVAPRTIDAVIANFSEVPVKGEFETTEAFQARLASAVGLGSSNIIISRTVDNHDAFAYDADSQKLRIKSGAFGYYINDVGMKFIVSAIKSTIR